MTVVCLEFRIFWTFTNHSLQTQKCTRIARDVPKQNDCHGVLHV